MAFDRARARLLPLVERALQDAVDRYGPAAGAPGPAVGSGPRFAPVAPGYYGMMRYHLGWVDERLEQAAGPTGKRLRPLMCLLATESCGGEAAHALPAAVALELLHNFTLIHDDIEDGDALRHHRPTVWKLWGEPQAINAGDGMHVISNMALYDLEAQGVPAARVLGLARRLASTCLAITEGQYLDLAFERRDDVTPAEYLDMIARKSAALLSCAAAMGAELAGAGAGAVDALADFGYQLGMGFQIRDDVLGIWGRAETTGKPAGDLRRRKKTLPALYALSREDEAGREALRRLFSAPQPDDELVAAALAVLDRGGARRHCEQMIARYSAAARERVATLPDSPARSALDDLALQLETREH